MEGKSIGHLPEAIGLLYLEARKALGAGAPTGCELVCRTLLGHIAGHLGWDGTGQFAGAVQHIDSSGFITPPMRVWVDRIRQHGNEAAHEVAAVNPQRATDTLRFTAALLELVFELPGIEASQGG
ncbi:MAG: DUF4145 domain-containing protein [Actinomycetia bacterium]|nr:DUF4145 domain-containing protein [Actinomycetes bacterium]